MRIIILQNIYHSDKQLIIYFLNIPNFNSKKRSYNNTMRYHQCPGHTDIRKGINS